jgi:hypothetical protein
MKRPPTPLIPANLIRISEPELVLEISPTFFSAPNPAVTIDCTFNEPSREENVSLFEIHGSPRPAFRYKPE